MIKASFIKKSVERFNTATVVTLNVKISNNIDTDLVSVKLWNWIETHPTFKKYALYTGESSVEITCKTRRHKGDVEDAKLAEMIAESKAKIKVYNFLYQVTKQIIQHISKSLFGSAKFVVNIKGNEDSIYSDYTKYQHLLVSEQEHLKNLYKKVKKQ